MRRNLLGIGALSTLVAGIGLVIPAAPALAVATEFSFGGSSYGTRATGGDLTVSNGKTVLSVLGCTVEAPEYDENRALEVGVDPLLITATTVLNTNQSKAVTGGYATVSRSRIESLEVTTPGGNLVVNGIDMKATASNVNGAFRASVTRRVASATFGTATIPIDQLSDPAGFEVVPGVLRVRLLKGSTTKSPAHAAASAAGLRIDLLLTNSTVKVAVANARIDRIVTGGPFGGGAQVAKGRIADGNTKLGPVINRPMPCVGTGGEWIAESVAQARLQNVADVRNAKGKVLGQRFTGGGGEAISVAFAGRINAGDGGLRIGSVLAKATVRQSSTGGYVKSTRFEVLSIEVNGESFAVPDPGDPLTIPGIATISVGIVTRGIGSIDIIALRIELLDGSGAVIDVARAKAKVS